MTGTSAQEQGRQAAHQVQNSKAFETGVRVGLVSYGIVHLLIAWIALQIAWGQEKSAASSSGALREMAGGTVGSILLWVVALGLVTLVFWQLSQAIWGHTDEDGAKRLVKRLTSAGRAVIYGTLAFSAFSTVTSSSSGGSSKDSLTADLMKMTGGQLLVGAIGLGAVAVGVALVVRGFTAGFTHHLQPQATSGSTGNVVVRLGQAGYVAKGVALGIIGGLFVWAAWTYDPQKAGGLDVALTTLLEQPFGPYLLTLVALGIAAFGAYSFAWARYPRE
ncbi:MAG: DUF1206 domain-containing protein [Nocardioidaceae bacterium]|nr:DUF1206 domain-containing protein [Nocardioidaceae bacterium]